jgi:Protein of unknown function (DUF1524)
MSTHRRLLALLIPAALIATVGTPAAAATAAPSRHSATVVTKHLRGMVRALPVRAERRDGYDRDKFVHWISQGSGCDTRDVVLYREAVVKPEIEDGCSLVGGRWRSYYDGKTTTDPSTFDVDHLVALAEAWDSGARRWTGATRKRYANDLNDPRTLVAVTASSNRSKSDSDPQDWLPPRRPCRYVREWVAVKTRWSLAVDRTEKRALTDLAGECKNVTLRVELAAVHLS